MDRRDLAANGLQHIHQGNLTLMAMILRASFDINLVKSHEANGKQCLLFGASCL